MHTVTDGAPRDERVVDQHEAILNPELENASPDDQISDKVPRAALHGLEAEGVVFGVGDPVCPHPNVGKAVVRLQSIVGNIEDVVAVDIDVPLRIRDAIGHSGDSVVGYDVPLRVAQFDTFAADPALVRRLIRVVIAHDQVVGDVPIATRRFEGDRIVEFVELTSPDHHVGSAVGCSQTIRLFTSFEVKSFEPKMAAVDPDGREERLTISGCLPHEILAGFP